MGLPRDWNLEEILALTYYRKCDPAVLKEAVESYSSLNNLLSSKTPPKLSMVFKQGELFPKSSTNIDVEAKLQIQRCRDSGYRIITFWDDEYPELLRHIHIPPVLLFVWGDLQASDAEAVSLVGTRKNTQYGKRTAKEFAEFFASNNIIVCSGLAEGLDSISHESAMKAGGITYAVIASGLDCVLPDRKKAFAREIVNSGGAIISEHKCGIKAYPPFFLQRNRIISGISRATIVVESAIKGGSMNTAKWALDQSREVFAVPGQIYSEKSMGTNLLIKKGAASPALNPESVFADLKYSLPAQNALHQERPQLNLDPVETKIFDNLSEEPIQIDKLAEKTEIDLPELLAKLLEMEFKDILRQLPGKYFVKA